MRRSGPNPKANKNILRLAYAVAGVFACLVLYLGYFLQFESDSVINNAYNPRVDLLAQRVVRGEILSADGQVLARDRHGGGRDGEAGVPRRFPVRPCGGVHRKREDGDRVPHQLLSAHLPRQPGGAGVQPVLRGEEPGRQCGGPPWIPGCSRRPGICWGDRRGAVAVMEPDTGKILAMVSKPGLRPQHHRGGLGPPDGRMRAGRPGC